ncbi:hypothetical protein G6N76_09900 [Rhizobium daejeonense]|uniref:CAP-Gly domain protein n=1 Tax=Rhizobium daejeonense TaxID=240521 RepID=A0A6M1S3Y3_9HYPH|nr:hypothetical protein [Rhizobium daejeonense]NGO63987.1 hypothetical protein [Rhizobium daejeonense]
MTTTIKPGDEIVCIDDGIYAEQYLGIKEGAVYKARWVGPATSYMNGDYIGVRLEGINRGVCPEFGDEDPPFNVRRFRPVVKPGTPAKELEEAL